MEISQEGSGILLRSHRTTYMGSRSVIPSKLGSKLNTL